MRIVKLIFISHNEIIDALQLLKRVTLYNKKMEVKIRELIKTTDSVECEIQCILSLRHF